MKRTGLLVTGIALLAAALLVLPSLNPAQAQVPDTTTPGTGTAWCHGDDGDDMGNMMQDHMGGAGGGYMSSGGASHMGQVELGRLAKVLGISTSDLVAKLQGGESLAQVAQGYGVTEEQLVNTLVEPYQARLAVQVQYGYLTQEEADQLLALAKERAQTTISQTNVLPSSSAGTTGSGTGYGPGGMMGSSGSYGFGGMMGGSSGGMMGRSF